MKITVDIPENEIKEAVENIPPDFFSRPGVSPIRTIAFALKEAWENRNVPPSAIKFSSVTKINCDEEIEGVEVIRVNLGRKGPLVMIPQQAVDDLRGPDGVLLREIIMDAIKATLDKICTH